MAGFVATWLNATLLTCFTEIGDKTFFVTALLARKNPPKQVYAACYSALAFMTALSGFLGSFLPVVVSPSHSKYLAAGLLLFFGFYPLIGKYFVTEEATDEEREAEEDVAKLQSQRGGQSTSGFRNYLDTLVRVFKPEATSSEVEKIWQDVILFSEMFLLVFLAEWGDKSQMSTITLSSSNIGFIPVTLGGMSGHAICSGLAVIFGKEVIEKLGIKEEWMEYIACGIFSAFAAQIVFTR